MSRFKSEAGIGEKKLLDNASIYLSILREQSPEYVNGINGISESSNIDIQHIA
ncbi:uncharacterized protein METZ01_LOCUS323129, partial [marine metagenome]